MRKIYLFLCVFLFTCAAASAQDNAKTKDIKKLIELSGASNLSMQVIQQSISQSRKNNTNNIPEEFWDEFLKEITKDDLVDMVLPLYDKYYTHDEVKQLLKFYQSPVGQKTIKVTPTLVQESMASGEELGKKVATRVIERMQAEGRFPK